MASRFLNISKHTAPQYASGCPLLLSAHALHLDQDTNQYVAQLKWQNITEKTVISAAVRLVVSEEEGGDTTFTFTGLHVAPDGEFGSREAIPLPGSDVTAFRVELTDVAYDDGSEWHADEAAEFLPLPASKPHGYPPELMEEFLKALKKKNVQTNVQHQLQTAGDLWQCVCGSWQQAGSLCRACHADYAVLADLGDKEKLAATWKRYKAEREYLQREQEMRAARQRQQELMAAQRKNEPELVFYSQQHSNESIMGHSESALSTAAVPAPTPAPASFAPVDQPAAATRPAKPAKASKATKEPKPAKAPKPAKKPKAKKQPDDKAAANKPKKRRSWIPVLLVLVLAAAVAAGGIFFWFLPMTHYNNAVTAMEEGRWTDAVISFTAAGTYRDAADRIPEPYYRKAEACLAKGEWAEAAAAFRKAGTYRDAADRVCEPYFLRAEAALTNPTPDEADNALRNALSEANWEKYPRSTEILLAVGNMCIEHQWWTEGLYWISLSGDEPALSSAHYVYGFYLMENNMPEDAIKYLSLVVDQIPEADPLFREANYLYADQLCLDGRYLDAAAHFAIAGDFLDASNRMLQMYWLQGDVYLNEGKFQDAIDMFKQAISLPGVAEQLASAYYLLGMQQLENGEYDNAIFSFTQAGTTGHADEMLLYAYYCKGIALMDAGEYDQAVGCFELAGDFSDAAAMIHDAYYRKGLALMDAGNEEEAIVAFTQAGDRPEAVDMLITLYCNKACRFAEEGDSQSAWNLYHQYRWHPTFRAVLDYPDVRNHERLYLTSTGSQIAMGTYEGQPIYWTVLSASDDSILVISSDIICKRPYHTESKAVAWGENNLRNWMNTSFEGNCFTPAERLAFIQTKVLPDPSHPDTYVTDTFFLFSREEAEVYTHTLKSNSASRDPWWLRTPAKGSNNYFYDGRDHVTTRSANVTNDSIGVRPVVWLDLNVLLGE